MISGALRVFSSLLSQIQACSHLWFVLENSRMLYFDVKGIVAPVFTPIDQHGQLDPAVIPEYARHLSENRVDGVMIGGTSGEAMCLSVEERKNLLEAWVTAARPRGLKVMTQIGGAPMPDVIALANHAEQMKVDGMMTLPELYFKPRTPAKLVDYLEQVSAAAPSVPLIYYHFPYMSGVDMSMPDLYKEATRRIPNFKGFKADLNVAVQLEEMLAPDHRVFIANHLLAPSVLMGHESSIATVTNLFPSLIRDLVDSAQQEMVPRSLMRKQAKLNSLVTAITQQGKWDFVASMKVAMELTTGISVGPPRSPIVPLDTQQKELMRSCLDEISGRHSYSADT